MLLVQSGMVYSNSFNLTLGNLHLFPGEIQEDEFGNEFNDFEFNPYFSLTYEHHLSINWSLLPELGMTWPKNGPDSDNSSKKIFYGGLDASYFFSTTSADKTDPESYLSYGIRPRLGLGLFVTRVGGEGGTQTQRNGNTSTDFPLPIENRSAMNFTVNAGLDFIFGRVWTLRTQVYAFTVTDSQSRNYGYLLAVSYNLGKINWDVF